MLAAEPEIAGHNSKNTLVFMTSFRSYVSLQKSHFEEQT